MTSPHLDRTADQPAPVPPDRRVAVDAELLEALRARVRALGAEDPTVAAAIEAGEDVAHAIDAGCPPQFHPGVAPEHAAVLRALRERLALGHADEVVVPPGADARFLRAIGLEVVADGPGA